jgi:hypothetical protein
MIASQFQLSQFQLSLQSLLGGLVSALRRHYRWLGGLYLQAKGSLPQRRLPRAGRGRLPKPAGETPALRLCCWPPVAGTLPVRAPAPSD